jgi:hypothetical protein
MLGEVADGLIAWKLRNVKEIQSIFDKSVVGLSREQFFNILKFVYRSPYDFLYINMDEQWDIMLEGPLEYTGTLFVMVIL